MRVVTGEEDNVDGGGRTVGYGGQEDGGVKFDGDGGGGEI